MAFRDVADEYPKAQVIGTDISPIQPTWVPPNARFDIEDCAKPWTYPSDSFDLVHIRYLFGALPDWMGLFKEAYRVCKPGGWIETVEPSCVLTSDDGSVAEGSPLHQWGKVFIAAGIKSGRTFTIVEDGLQLKGLDEAGFVGKVVKNYKVGGTLLRKPKRLLTQLDRSL